MRLLRPLRGPAAALAAVALLATAPGAGADPIRPDVAADALPIEVIQGLAQPGSSARKVRARTRGGVSWADESIRAVVATGALPGVTVRGFRPDDVLDGPTLDALVRAAFPGQGAPAHMLDRTSITMGQLNSAFVRAAGLFPSALRASRALNQRGIGPRNGGGVEIVARLLALRYNHPSGTDARERSPWEPATRAEAAYTTARALSLDEWDVDYVADQVALFDELPTYEPAQQVALKRATRLLGQPYIWGGEWDATDSPYGYQEHGGYDCSGFVWRVFGLYPGAPAGALDAIGGRTTYDMARSTAKRDRLAREDMRPGDLLLFASSGNNGAATKVDAIGHVGIMLSDSLFIHSSSQGVAIARWDEGWYASSFAFGRRVLAG